MQKILVIRLYFSLDALHVSDYISPSSGATFVSCKSHLVWLLCGYNPTTARRMVSAYTKFDVQLIKVAAEDRLIQSETCITCNGK